jgi:hypothetical protein
MTDHRYMYPRVTELRELRPVPPSVPSSRHAAPRPSQRRLVQMSLLRVPEAR